MRQSGSGISNWLLVWSGAVLRGGTVAGVALTCSLLARGTLQAQGGVPDKFENLQVLPKDISRDSLETVMRGFTGALGVRCEYCHVRAAGNAAPPPPDTAGRAGGGGRGRGGFGGNRMDYKSDDKVEKKRARFMLKMVQQINGTILPDLPERPEHPVSVSCQTCHHGQNRPQTVQAVLSGVIAEQGMDSAVAKYRTLRQQYYGRDVFDFSPLPLIDLGRSLSVDGKQAEAIRMLELDYEFYPQEGTVTMSLGDTYLARGDTAKAVDYYRKTLEIQPNNRRVQQTLQRLGGG